MVLSILSSTLDKNSKHIIRSLIKDLTDSDTVLTIAYEPFSRLVRKECKNLGIRTFNLRRSTTVPLTVARLQWRVTKMISIVYLSNDFNNEFNRYQELDYARTAIEQYYGWREQYELEVLTVTI